LVELAEAAGLEAEAALRAVTVQLREALIMLEAQAAARGEEFLSLDDETRSSMWRQWLDDFSVSQ